MRAIFDSSLDAPHTCAPSRQHTSRLDVVQRVDHVRRERRRLAHQTKSVACAIDAFVVDIARRLRLIVDTSLFSLVARMPRARAVRASGGRANRSFHTEFALPAAHRRLTVHPRRRRRDSARRTLRRTARARRPARARRHDAPPASPRAVATRSVVPRRRRVARKQHLAML